MTSVLIRRGVRFATLILSVGLSALLLNGPLPAAAAPIGTWCAAGDWQSEDDGGSDWDNNRHALTDPDTDDIFTYTTPTLPAGSYNAKVFACEDWGTGFPNGNYTFSLSADGPVTFSFDTNTYTDGFYPATNIMLVVGADVPADAFTAVGSWQSEAGGSDWTNDDPVTGLIDMGGGIWQGAFTVNAGGTYDAKIQETGSWDLGYDITGRSFGTAGGNGSVTANAGEQLLFTLDLNTSRWAVEAVSQLSWCAAGDFNGFDNSSHPLFDDGTNGDVTANDGVFSYEYTEANASSHNFTIVECGNWDNTYPELSNSFYTTTAPNQAVRFEFTVDTLADGFYPQQFIPNTVGDTEPTGPFVGVGNWQSEAGGSDYNNADPVTTLTDDGGGIFSGVFPLDTAGTYLGRVTFSGSWDRYDAQGLRRDTFAGADIEFSTGLVDDPVTITLDVNQSRVRFEGTAEATVTYCAAGEWQGAAWNPSINEMLDDGTGGDLVAGDGIYSYQITVDQPGTYGWKVAQNCNWGIEYPGGFGVDSYYTTTALGETVTLTFDTNDYSADDFQPDSNIVHALDSIGNAAGFAVVGTFQDDLGGSNGDTSDPNVQMVDDGTGDDAAAGDGIYTLTLTLPNAGGYTAEFAVSGGDPFAIDEQLGRVRGSLPLLVITATDDQDVVFFYDSNTGRGTFDTASSGGKDNNLIWEDMLHDSRNPIFRSPGGPLPVGSGEVTLRFATAADDAEVVLIRVFNDRTNENTIAAMGINPDLSNANYDVYEYTLTLPSEPTALFYWFLAVDGTAEAYYQDDADPGGVYVGGTGEPREDNADLSWQLTVYDPAFTTPEWVQNAVIYQIFPERFRDGDPANNPTAGNFFYDEPYGTIVRSLGTDWNTVVCDPRVESGDGCENSYSRNFYGGDLQGITEMIESGYFTDLGVTALYLNPIFEAPSNHKYDTFDFLQVDDNFGGQAAYDAMIAAADEAGIQIILDGVFNHASSDSVYFDRYERWDVNGNSTGAPFQVDDNSGACEDETEASSPWADWFNFFPYQGDETAPCDGDRDYPYWFGIFDSLAVFDSDNPVVQGYFYADGLSAVGPYWIDQGADGWRLDVAPEIDHGTQSDPTDLYWEGFRDAVHAVNPDTYIVGEEWGIATSWTIGGDNGTGPVGEWDATMNYQFGAATVSFWRDTSYTDNDFNSGSSARVLAPLTPSQWDARMQNLLERYPPEAFAAMMNLFGSHDTNRALFLLNHDPNLVNDPAQAMSDMQSSSYPYWGDAIDRLKGATLIQFTMPGAPTLYYGNEIGLVGPVGHDGSQWQDDPYNRQPYPRFDETGTPFYDHLQSAAERADLFAFNALLADTRNEHSFLRTGSYDPLLLDDANMVLAYGRQDQNGTAVVIVNRSTTVANQAVSVPVDGYIADGTVLYDVISGNSVTVSGGTINGSLPMNGYALLVPPTLPDAQVSGVAVETAGSDLAISWDDNATNEDGFIIERSLDGLSGWVQVGTVDRNDTTFTDDTVACGQEYWYRVLPFNGDEVFQDGSEATDSNVGCSLLTNGGLETDGGWSFVGGAKTLDNPGAYSGDSVALVPADGTTIIRQVVDFSGGANDAVELRFHVAGQALASGGQVGARIEMLDGGTVVDVTNCVVSDRGSFGWQLEVCSLTATTSFDQIRVTLGLQGVPSGFLGFDAISLILD
ncbi:MAG: alpha-amylase family glycosyl hydrolase [Anaerolineae bacterium]